MSKPTAVQVSIDGKTIQTTQGRSILQAILDGGQPLTDGVGCMGQGVCGSCRVLLRRAGSREVGTALACETQVEDGMQVSFLDHLSGAARHHPYSPDDWKDSWRLREHLHTTFPEAIHCRHCGGCDRACPKHLEVQKGVNIAAAGDLSAGDYFDECIMCNLCTIACPEQISPNHLGLYVRRLNAVAAFRPSDLLQRLWQMENGEMEIDSDVEVA